MSTFVDRLRQRLRELRAANGANVTMTFALATIPLVGFVGAAVDYSHANSVKAAMQAAVDATGLMLSKEVNNLNESEVLTKANAEKWADLTTEQAAQTITWLNKKISK